MHSFDAPGGTTFHFNGDLSGDLHFSPDTPYIAPLSDVLALLQHWQQRYPEALARATAAMAPSAAAPAHEGDGVLLLGSAPTTTAGRFW